MKKRKIGLVLSGGGAKGAYLLGVWKALKELGIDKLIDGVSGVSIGALTGYMFAIDNYEQARRLWENAKQVPIQGHTKSQKIIHKIFGKNTQIAFNNLTNNSYLSSKKLDNLLDDIINIEKLKTTACKCYITCHNIQENKPETFLLNNYPKENIKQILKATTAIPILFKKVKLQEKTYYDGGLSVNTPILPLYENDYNVIIVVYLDDKGHHDYRLYQGSYFIEISPRVSIGNFRNGVLNFSADKIDELIKRGYEDAYDIFQKNLELLNKEFI